MFKECKRRNLLEVLHLNVFSVAMIKIMTQATWKRRGLSSSRLQPLAVGVRTGTEGRNLEVRTEAGDMRDSTY